MNLAFSRFFSKQWLSRNSGIILTFAVILSAIVTFATITDSDIAATLKPKRVLNLLWVNIGLLVVLAALIGRKLYTLWASLRRQTAGSNLQKHILLMFSAVTITPTLIVAIFSALLFNFGIQSWFNERVQTAVEESLAVAEAYLNEHKENIRGDAIAMAGDLNRVADLARSDPAAFNQAVANQSALRVLTEAIVLQRNHIIAQGNLSFALSFERIPFEWLERAERGEVVVTTTEDDKIRAVVKLTALDSAYLIVGRLVDSKVLAHMSSAQGAVSEYGTLKQQIANLQVAFSIVFLTLALLLLLAALWYGMVFAARLTKPISNLVQVADRVRGGDYSARITDNLGNDEMGTLSRTFNRMTEQLEAQRGDLIQANRQLDERRRFSEAVLSGVSAGIIALDSGKQITLVNRSCIAVLAAIEQPIAVGMPIAEAMPGIHELLAQAESLPDDITQSTLTLSKDTKSITLHVRVAVEKAGGEIEGFIVTFDDITPLVAAQRNAAWADVARRVAHEIKNPLTPIQLSAERLKKKYLKFITEDQENYIKYIDNIEKHVGDIGRMVEEFVAFARMPTARMAVEDLTSIVRKAVFSSQVAFPNYDIHFDAPAQPVPLEVDERQFSQVLTNLIKNAAESVEARLALPENAQEKGEITLSLTLENERILLAIEDNGTGFPGDEPGKMLEPYVTTRSKGTGLGLAIVKKIIDDHKGLIFMENRPNCGAKVTLSFPQHCDI